MQQIRSFSQVNRPAFKPSQGQLDWTPPTVAAQGMQFPPLDSQEIIPVAPLADSVEYFQNRYAVMARTITAKTIDINTQFASAFFFILSYIKWNTTGTDFSFFCRISSTRGASFCINNISAIWTRPIRWFA